MLANMQKHLTETCGEKREAYYNPKITTLT